MSNYPHIILLGLCCLISLQVAIYSHAAKTAVANSIVPTVSTVGQQSQVPQVPAVAPSTSSSSSTKWLKQARSRSSRSLSDMFEKVKSKIFGTKKSQQAIAPSASQPVPVQSSAPIINQAQRQPWEVNQLSQQYQPFNNLQTGYQWPAGALAPSNYLNGQYGNQFPTGTIQYPSIGQIQSNQPGVGHSLDGSIPSSQQSSLSGNSGLLSSASQLFSQYLSPNSAPNQASILPSQQSGVQQQQQQQQQASQNSPFSTNQQTQYNELASMLDSMVAQTGLANPSQRQTQNQYASNSAIAGLPNQQGSYQALSVGDQDIAASSNVEMLAQPGSPIGSSGSQSPVSNSAQIGSVGVQPQASQKSSMVSLAEQLAPGAQFNKLISFPFSLSNNDDPNKEGRFKLHIPFLNTHVAKRSDQQQQQQQSISGQQPQRPLQSQQQRSQQSQQQLFNNQYYGQQLVGAPFGSQQQQQQQQQLIEQASQQVASVINPLSAPVQSNSLVPSQVQSISVSSSSSSVQSSPSSSSSLQSSPSLSSSLVSTGTSAAIQAASQSRPTWSVADIQSSSSSSKLIPLPHGSVSSQSGSSADSPNSNSVSVSSSVSSGSSQI